MVVARSNNPADKVVNYAYQYYDANGKNNNRIRQITDNIDTAYTTSYLYDDYNRLTNATANAFSRSYQYDEWGNVKNFAGLTLNYQTNVSGAPATNRINTDSQSYSYTYDAAGNQTAGAGQSYSYDGANRLKTASGGTSSYGYDGDGKRVKKTENGATTYYVYSSKLGQSVMEVTANSIQRAYVYSGSKLVAMQATDGQFYWLHTNHLGNSRAMTDASGNLTYKGQFDPYGATLTEWANSGNTNLNSKKFTGYERDSATGLDYAQARMYNSARGQFMTPDIAGLDSAELNRPQSLNRYSYVTNDPINMVDPSGLDGVPILRINTSAPYLEAYPVRWPYPNRHGINPVVLELRERMDEQNQSDRSILDKAIERAKRRIQGDCAKLFGNLNVEEYLKNNFFIQPTMQDGRDFDDETVYASTSDDPTLKTRSTHFNPKSTFFTGKLNGISFNKMIATLTPKEKEEAALSRIRSLSDSQELTILHELYHAAEKTITNDEKEKWKGRDIDRLIQEKCF